MSELDLQLHGRPSCYPFTRRNSISCTGVAIRPCCGTCANTKKIDTNVELEEQSDGRANQVARKACQNPARRAPGPMAARGAGAGGKTEPCPAEVPLCAEAGWLILVNAWLPLERAYLSCACFCECDSRRSRTKNGEVRDALLHHSDRGTPPVEATPDGNNSLYCFNFLTQRGTRWPPKAVSFGRTGCSGAARPG